MQSSAKVVNQKSLKDSRSKLAGMSTSTLPAVGGTGRETSVALAADLLLTAIEVDDQSVPIMIS